VAFIVRYHEPFLLVARTALNGIATSFESIPRKPPTETMKASVQAAGHSSGLERSHVCDVDHRKFGNIGAAIMGSTADKASGLANEAAGKAKQSIGNVVGSDKLKTEGAAQELKGDAQKATGDAKAAVKDAANKTANAINKNA
jgi:uncharacterized protein YjbJ (UPF0337 family)